MYIYNTLTSYVKCYKQYDSNGMKNYNINKNHFLYIIYISCFLPLPPAPIQTWKK